MVTLKTSTWVIAGFVLAACIDCPAGAQQGFIGLYLDDARTTWCASGTPPYQVEMGVWAMVEGEVGIRTFGFGMTLPPNVEADWQVNPEIIGELCSPGEYCPPPYHGAFKSCMKPGVWIWLERCTLTVSSSDPTAVALIGYPETGVIGLGLCDGTNLNPTILNGAIYLNEDCTSLPTHPATWGAVKALFEG